MGLIHSKWPAYVFVRRSPKRWQALACGAIKAAECLAGVIRGCLLSPQPPSSAAKVKGERRGGRRCRRRSAHPAPARMR
jgi:hypothetical protein